MKPCECGKVDHHGEGKKITCRILNCPICKKIEQDDEENPVKVKAKKVSKRSHEEEEEKKKPKRRKRAHDDISDDEEEEVYPEWLTKEHETGYILCLEVKQKETKGGKSGGKAGGKGKK